jgi:hypothetical protein
MKPTLARRLADSTVAFLSWAVTVFAVLWFYDWVSRWYVVVAVLLTAVGAGMLGERARAGKAGVRQRPALSAVQENLWPLQRDGDQRDGDQRDGDQRDGDQRDGEAADVSGRSAEVALLRPPA